MLAEIAISLATSFVGSLVAFVVAIHFDIPGYFEQKQHERVVRKQRKFDPGAQRTTDIARRALAGGKGRSYLPSDPDAHQPPDPIPGVGDVGARPPQILHIDLDKPEETR